MAGEMILHSDLNCFYASVEMNEKPYLRGKAIAVCGSTEDRHGIVLTASYPAKRMGVKTGAAMLSGADLCAASLRAVFEVFEAGAAHLRPVYG